ncbi:MAG: hypothetical protein FJZ58_08205, partial [Chlamydiae bacterium]|nr:hypothetical protein [Chlamydiota bacterium]
MFRAEKKVTWLLWMVVLYLGVGLDADCDSVQFGWGEKKETYDIDTQLEERWAYSLLQECIRSGLENLLAEEGVPHEIQVEEGFLPCQFSGMVRGESEEGEKIVSLLEERDPSLLSQFTEVKKGWLSWLEHRQSNSSSSFLERSKMTLQIISLDHLLSLFQKVEFLPEKKGWESSSGEGRGGKPKSEEAKLFFELPLTDEDKMLT